MKTNSDGLKKNYSIVRFIGIAMIVSVFIYAIVVEFIKREYAPFEGFAPFNEIYIVRYVLLGLAFIEFFLIGFINKVILSGKMPAQANFYRQETVSSEIQKLTSAAIISYALCESVAIYGLILFILNGGANDFYAFFVLSIICFGKYFPRYAQGEEFAKKSRQP